MVIASWASNCAVHKPSLMLPMSWSVVFRHPKRNCESSSKSSIWGTETGNIIHVQVDQFLFLELVLGKRVKHWRPTCPTRSPPSMGPRNGDAQWRGRKNLQWLNFWKASPLHHSHSASFCVTIPIKGMPLTIHYCYLLVGAPHNPWMFIIHHPGLLKHYNMTKPSDSWSLINSHGTGTKSQKKEVTAVAMILWIWNCGNDSVTKANEGIQVSLLPFLGSFPLIKMVSDGSFADTQGNFNDERRMERLVFGTKASTASKNCASAGIKFKNCEQRLACHHWLNLESTP